MSTNLITRIFVVVIVIAVALVTVSFVNGSTPAVSVDRSYDRIEHLRLHQLDPNRLILSGYEQIEALRALKFMAHTVFASGYEEIEAVRLQRNLAATAYEQVEALRLQRSLSPRAAYRGAGANPSLMAQQAYRDFRHGEWSGK